MNSYAIANYVKNHDNFKFKVVDDKSPLSWNYPCTFKIPQSEGSTEGVTFSNVNQAFAYLKAVFFEKDNLLEDIVQVKNVKEVNVTLKACQSSAWDKSKGRVMLLANFYKFEQPEFKQALFATNDDILLFAGHNKYWTCGKLTNLEDYHQWSGSNQLASVLNKLKEMLEPHDDIDHVY